MESPHARKHSGSSAPSNAPRIGSLLVGAYLYKHSGGIGISSDTVVFRFCEVNHKESDGHRRPAHAPDQATRYVKFANRTEPAAGLVTEDEALTARGSQRQIQRRVRKAFISIRFAVLVQYKLLVRGHSKHMF